MRLGRVGANMSGAPAAGQEMGVGDAHGLRLLHDAMDAMAEKFAAH